MLLALLLIVAAAAFSIRAADTDTALTPDRITAQANAMDFSDAGNLPDYCPACGGENVTWTAVKDRIGYGKSGHYYIPAGGVTLGANVNNFATAAANSTLCIHLNGQPVQYGSRIAPNSTGSVVNIMGGNGGTVTLVPFTGTDAAANGSDIAALDANTGELNIYGGTYTTTDASRPVLRVRNTGVAKVYGATIDGDGTARSIYVEKGSLHLEETTVQNGVADYGGNLRSAGTVTMDGGTIIGGEATIGGGNVYINGGVFTINSGELTGGKTTAADSGLGGGNIFTYSGEVYIKGTEGSTRISDGIAQGTSSASGGNIRIAGGSLTMEGGTVTGGSAKYAGGNLYITGGRTVQLKGGRFEGGSCPQKNGSSIFLYNGKLTVAKGVVIDNGTGSGNNMIYVGSSANNTLESAGDLLGGTTFIGANVNEAEITGGKVYALNVESGANCIISGGKFREQYAAYLAQEYRFVETGDSDYAYIVTKSGMTAVDAGGGETEITDLLTAWETGEYACLRLYVDGALELNGQDIWIDLNGNTLTLTGSGKLNALDSANDTYNADACGQIINNGAVQVAADVTAPNGNHYIAVTEGNATTMHRLDAPVTTVSLRPSAAGLYYKATYSCDVLLSAKVLHYGVVLSVDNMPGSDFLNEAGDINRYTVAGTDFVSGAVATSGSVFGIMKTEREAAKNARYGEIEIYANPYLLLELNGVQTVVMGDTRNDGKTTDDAEFTGTAWSLHEVMDALDQSYSSYSGDIQERLDNFYKSWEQDGMADWKFDRIGSDEYTRDLSLGDDGIGYCPVCRQDVQWTALTDTTKAQSLKGHYYLTGDLEYAGTDAGGYIYNGTGNTTLCLHLNGHNITATGTRAIFGSSGRVNVMGKGEVTGYNGYASQYGAAVQTNNSVANNGVYLYGGTYKKAAGSSANVAVLGTNTVGGTIHVYKGATIEAAGDLAVRTSVSTTKDVFVGLYDCTVNGDVVLHGAATKLACACTAELLNCTVNGNVRADGQGCEITVDSGRITGTLDADDVGGIKLGHDAKLGLLDMEGNTLITMDNMTDGADIPVANTGVLTLPHDNAADWAKYFTPRQLGDVILVENGALRCRTDYTSKLNPDAEGKAVCPVCRKIVVWTPVATNDRLVAEKDGHYYLTADVLFEKEFSEAVSYLYGGSEWRDGSACFHLNGHSITATKTYAIYGGYGVLNVMGTGVVTGYGQYSNQNAAAQINNSVAGNGLNLYSGTYQKSADSGALTSVIGTQDIGGTLRIYQDVEIRNSGSNAMYIGSSERCNTTVELHDVTVPGNVKVKAPTDSTQYTATLTGENITVTGEMDVGLGNQVFLDGVIRIGKLTLPAGQKVTIGDLAEGSAITVSADGFFTNTTEKADRWLSCITCADEGDWIFERDKQLYQGARASMAMTATENAADIAALEAVYAGKTVKYGEMHNHTNSGPRKGYNTGADGRNSLQEWMTEMDRLQLDFATIVDHGQSIHMYYDDWKAEYFVGGTEPATTITDSKATGGKSPHYNMLFSDPADLEAIMNKWSAKYAPVTESGYEGLRLKYASFTTAEFAQLAQDVYAQGGLLVQVHPKYDSYIYSDDPLDYYFADYTGLEITTGSGGNMAAKDNEEGYQLWVDLLQLDKKIWATAGSDIHHLPDTSALTTMYTDQDHCDTYLEHMRAGNFAPGWVGIRMNIGDAAMGGETDFAGKRLVFSVGDIYICDQQDTEGTDPVYIAGHTYRVELYDDSGLLSEAVIDPTQMNYFAIDCDQTAKYYRVVVWDDTVGTRIGVSNPIWNTEA